MRSNIASRLQSVEHSLEGVCIPSMEHENFPFSGVRTRLKAFLLDDVGGYSECRLVSRDRGHTRQAFESSHAESQVRNSGQFSATRADQATRDPGRSFKQHQSLSGHNLVKKDRVTLT